MTEGLSVEWERNLNRGCALVATFEVDISESTAQKRRAAAATTEAPAMVATAPAAVPNSHSVVSILPSLTVEELDSITPPPHPIVIDSFLVHLAKSVLMTFVRVSVIDAVLALAAAMV